jgi:hypothetical protein
VSDLRARAGKPIAADKWNAIVDRLPESAQKGFGEAITRLRLCRTTKTISASSIDASDTADSVYESGVVNTYGLENNEDGAFSPALSTSQRIMINASEEAIPSGTELWAIESFDGILVSTVWIC